MGCQLHRGGRIRSTWSS